MPMGRRGFTLLELLMAVGILAFCFVPILSHSRATVQETESAQEDVLARHFLMDLVERYKGASMAELALLPATEPVVALGDDPPIIKNDGLLSETDTMLAELKALSTASGGTTQYVDGGMSGLQKFVDLRSMVKLTRLAMFQPDPNVGNPSAKVFVNLLICKIRYQGRMGQVKELVTSKIIVRDNQ